MKKILFVTVVLLIFAFQSKEKSITSSKKFKKEFALIPSGNVLIESKSSSVQSFFISKTEVTNEEFHNFLNELKTENRLDEYTKFLPDTSQWSIQSKFFSQFESYYFSHPAYQKFPVVNVSFEAAEAYCLWYTEKMKKQYGENINPFRIPTREEFIRACRGNNHQQIYSWKENGVRNKDNMIVCNHSHPDTSNFAGSLSDKNDVTAPAKSYWPNEFGVYNLNGNVAEMTNKKGIATGGSWRNEAKDVQNESVLNYHHALPNVGFRMVTSYLGKK